MEFNNPQIGTLNKRYKRFFVDINLPNGEIITAHCCNTGAMTGLLSPNALCMFSKINSKLGYQWQMIFCDNTWVGVNTIAANNLFKQWLYNNNIFSINNDSMIKPEYNLKNINGDSHRIDFYLNNVNIHNNNIPNFSLLKKYNGDKPWLIEVKHVQWKVNNQFIFPDTPTARGTSQVKSLIKLHNEYNLLIVFMIQRSDGDSVAIAKHIDPIFHQTIEELINRGGMVIGLKCQCINNTINPWQIIPYIH